MVYTLPSVTIMHHSPCVPLLLARRSPCVDPGPAASATWGLLEMQILRLHWTRLWVVPGSCVFRALWEILLQPLVLTKHFHTLCPSSRMFLIGGKPRPREQQHDLSQVRHLQVAQSWNSKPWFLILDPRIPLNSFPGEHEGL